MRLTPRAAEIGLATEERVRLLEEKIRLRDELIAFISGYSIRPDKIQSSARGTWARSAPSGL